VAWDILSGQCQNIGKHNAGIVNMFYVNQINMLVSFSLDKTFKFWDLKSQQPKASFQMNQKIFCADIVYPIMLLGMANNQCSLMDITQI